MDTEKAYNQWAKSYDAVENPTRDLDQKATMAVLGRYDFSSVIELGCGTGKNTPWLCDRATQVYSVDFSEKMLEKAREKVKDKNVLFAQADILKPWAFVSEQVALVTSSLVLEHIEDLSLVFAQAAKALKKGGRFFICELHPIKQYLGSKARFEQNGQLIFLDGFVHHISDYLNAAAENGLQLLALKEWFEEEKSEVPRLVSFVFEKNVSLRGNV